MRNYFWPAMAAIILMPGCSSNHLQPEIRETFVANILVSGEKQFQMTFAMEPQGGSHSRRPGPPRMGGHGGPGPSAGDGPPGGMPPGRGNRTKERPDDSTREDTMREDFAARLDTKIKATGYCRDGYDITEESLGFGPGNQYLRGRCLELASEEDRSNFPSAQNRSKVTVETLDLDNTTH